MQQEKGQRKQDRTEGKIATPPKPKLQAPNPSPSSIRTAHERIKFLFTPEPGLLLPDPYVGLAPIPLIPTNMRTTSASTKASEREWK